MANKNEVQRRDVLRGVGMAIGAALLPKAAAASTRPTLTQGAIVEHLAARYANELERLGEKVKPLFASGRVRGFLEGSDLDEGGPVWRLQQACLEHFNLSEETPWIDILAILAVSPSAEATEHFGWDHPCYHASAAVEWDLIRMARARNWYTPGVDADGDPEEPTAEQLAGVLS